MSSREFTLVSWNLYLGADVLRLVDGLTITDPPLEERAEALWEMVGHTNFPLRARYIAARIVDAQADVVALQEVFRWTLTPTPGSDAGGFDFLEVLLRELAARGLDFVAHRTWGFTCKLPLREGRSLTMEDSVVVLVRQGHRVTGAHGGRYEPFRTVPIGGQAVPAHRTWMSLDAEVRGERVRIVNTHLEFAADTQAAQVKELLARLRTHPGRTILAGDFNIAAPVRGEPAPGARAYRGLHAALLDDGFQDAWLERGGPRGFTSTQREDLRNEESELSERIDWVMARGTGAVARTWLLGAQKADRIELGQWPSDHAGVATTLSF